MKMNIGRLSTSFSQLRGVTVAGETMREVHDDGGGLVTRPDASGERNP